ncbi:hypothetical protein EV182_000107 [Spiromyces aspiralis]|uniref:Uncharacterized protein n=1 Tax=Spiromyces aspiralis TaxID=68401 RepID=A0ACC1HXG6_9FUNG|nr:hypothetical protein EV182_000107 [Spiromyces aspiralis]
MVKPKKAKLRDKLKSFITKQSKRPKTATAGQSGHASTSRGSKGASPQAPNQQQKKKQVHRFDFPYSATNRILLVGEGNFSFAHSLAATFKDASNMIATAYDTESVVYQKYPDARHHINEFRKLGGQAMFDVDATKLEKRRLLKGKQFDRIVFNFPHVGLGIKDRDRNIHSNQELLLGFFSSASGLLSPVSPGDKTTGGEIHVSLKSGLPYDDWGIRGLARKAGLVGKATVPFDLEWFPLYQHRRTLGFKTGLSVGENQEIAEKHPKIYMFLRSPSAEQSLQVGNETRGSSSTKKRNKRYRDEEDSESDESEC